jgi:hypothetical protein
MLGQHAVEVTGDTARGTLYCQVKLVTDGDNGEVVADSSIIYTDEYAFHDGRWLISSRISRFTIIDRRPLSS